MYFKLAYRNIIGSGLRTWLIVFILSLSYIIIIGHKGMLDGWYYQSHNDMINWEVAGGQYWQQEYDPYDPFTIIDSHGLIPNELQDEISKGNMTAMLYTQATIYPDGHQRTIMLKGIDEKQQIIEIPSAGLTIDEKFIPVIIGKKMASSNKLKIGDYVTLRWRDVNGVYDADEVKIVGIFKTNVPSLDNAQMYIPLANLQSMLSMNNEATIIIKKQNLEFNKEYDNWDLKSQKFLMKDLIEIMKVEHLGGSLLWGIVLLLALLAIFDTQILTVFKRQKEIGTYLALGMTKTQVIKLFTLEGALYGFLAAVCASVYGTPLLILFAKNGITMPVSTDEYGIAISETLYPMYSFGLVASTVCIILFITTIVSYLPVKKISKMKPTDAIKGKLQ